MCLSTRGIARKRNRRVRCLGGTARDLRLEIKMATEGAGERGSTRNAASTHTLGGHGWEDDGGTERVGEEKRVRMLRREGERQDMLLRGPGKVSARVFQARG